VFDLSIDVTDVSLPALRCVRDSLETRNSFALQAVLMEPPSEEEGSPAEQGQDSVRLFRLPFEEAAAARWAERYDFVYASDIAYDEDIARGIAPALRNVLHRDGTAILCNEAFRDGWGAFLAPLLSGASNGLRASCAVDDVQRVVDQYALPLGLSNSTVALVVIERC
jgi:hypothetical protein